jgi:hypothetical protein
LAFNRIFGSEREKDKKKKAKEDTDGEVEQKKQQLNELTNILLNLEL